MPASEPAAYGSWTFNQDGCSEGWRLNYNVANLSVANGDLSFQMTASNPSIVSGTMSIDPSQYRYLQLRINNGSAETQARVFWRMHTESTWDLNKHVDFAINANGWGDYTIDLGQYALWTNAGTVEQIKIDPVAHLNRTSPSKTVNIDYIKLSASGQ